MYDLPKEGWSYVKKIADGRGYRHRPNKPFNSVSIQPGKRLEIVAKGPALGHTLRAIPNPSTWH